MVELLADKRPAGGCFTAAQKTSMISETYSPTISKIRTECFLTNTNINGPFSQTLIVRKRGSFRSKLSRSRYRVSYVHRFIEDAALLLLGISLRLFIGLFLLQSVQGEVFSAPSDCKVTLPSIGEESAQCRNLLSA